MLGALATQPGFAKGSHIHAGAKQAVATAQKRANAKDTAAKRMNAKGTNSIGAPTRNAIDTGNTPLSSPPAVTPEKAKDLNAKLPMNEPGNLQTRHPRASVPSNAVTRNAIGLPVAHDNMTDGGARFGATGQPNAILMRPAGGTTHADAGRGEPNIGRQSPLPSGANTASPSKTDGVRLIRPSLALSGIGGPAKAAAGINGTMVRPKR